MTSLITGRSCSASDSRGLGIDPALRFCYPTSQKMFWEEKAGPGGKIYFLGPPCLVRGLKRKLLTKPIVLEAVLERKLLTKSIVFISLGGLGQTEGKSNKICYLGRQNARNIFQKSLKSSFRKVKRSQNFRNVLKQGRAHKMSTVFFATFLGPLFRSLPPPPLFSVGDPIVKDPIVADPIVKDPIVRDPIVKDPIVGDPIVKKPIVGDPIVKEPIVKDPIVKDPIMGGFHCEFLKKSSYNVVLEKSS